MTKFNKSKLDIKKFPAFLKERERAHGKPFTPKEVEHGKLIHQSLKDADVFKNDTYMVIVDYSPELSPDIHVADILKGEVTYLSIKRNDKEAIRDWRDLQEIKNILVGEENEGVEVFPAESRLVGTSIQ